MNDLLGRLRAADPAAAAAPLDDEARATLARIVATPVAPPAMPPAGAAPVPARVRARRAPRRAGLAGALVAAAVAAYVLVPADTPLAPAPKAYAATPPMLDYESGEMPARAILRALAERAEAQPRKAPGRYDYVHTRGWALGTSTYLDGGPSPRPPITDHHWEENEHRFWLGDDGSGRHDRDMTVTDGVAPPDNPEEDATYGPGELGGRKPIPTDDAKALRERLYYDPKWDAGKWVEAIRSVWGEKVVEPDEQAALLRALADVDGVVFRGRVTDRAGREGVVVSGDSDWGGFRMRHVLVLDPETGAVLDAEMIALEEGDLPIKAPATISYTVFVESHRVASLDATR